MSIQVGDYVRSFDFATTWSDGEVTGKDLDGKRACYIEGRVKDIVRRQGSLRYQIAVEKEVFAGQEESLRIGSYVFPPVNGTNTLLGYGKTNFVDLV